MSLDSTDAKQIPVWQVRLAGALLDSARIGGFLSLACLRNGVSAQRTALLSGGFVILWTGTLDLSYRLLRKSGVHGHAAHDHDHHQHDHSYDADEPSAQDQAIASAGHNPAVHLVGGVVSELLIAVLLLAQKDEQAMPVGVVFYAMIVTLIVQIWRLRLPAFARGGSSFLYPLLGTGLALGGGVLLGILFQHG